MQRPYTCIVSEMSVDGKLTLGKGISSKILMEDMDKESKTFLHKLRTEYDAIMVGSNTIKIDDSILTVRHVEGKNPIRIIPCSDAKLPPDSKVLNKDAETIIVVSNIAKEEDIKKLEEREVKIIKCGEEKINLVELMDKLHTLGIKKLIVEGGPTLSYHMIKNRLVDEIKIIHIPLIVGGNDVPSLIGGISAKNMDDVINVELENFFKCGKHLISEYRIKY